MKRCNICHMVVDADTECPICGNTITYEPEIESTHKKYVFNKYLLLYVLKNFWFTAIMLIHNIYVLINSIFVVRERDTHIFTASIYAIIIMIISLYVSVFNQHYREICCSRIKSEWVKNFWIGFLKYIFGGISILIFALIYRAL